MLYTLTTNPAIDMNISSDGLKPNAVTRTRAAVYTPNGKGLNVSFTLQHWGVPSTILGFFGGFSGQYIVKEASKICPVKSVEIDGITRVNVFLNTGDAEYTLPNAGAPVNPKKQQEMIDLIADLEDLEYLVISGSLSPEMDEDFYKRVLEVVSARDCKVVLDISAVCLKDLLVYKPLLIKPNEAELKDIFDIEVTSSMSLQEVKEALAPVHKLGAQNILLTMGKDGAYFSDGCDIYHVNSAEIKILSTACAGDATLASFLSIWLNDVAQTEEALKRAMAAGANVAMSAGLGDFALLDNLKEQIQITSLKGAKGNSC